MVKFKVYKMIYSFMYKWGDAYLQLMDEYSDRGMLYGT